MSQTLHLTNTYKAADKAAVTHTVVALLIYMMNCAFELSVLVAFHTFVTSR